MVSSKNFNQNVTQKSGPDLNRLSPVQQLGFSGAGFLEVEGAWKKLTAPHWLGLPGGALGLLLPPPHVLKFLREETGVFRGAKLNFCASMLTEKGKNLHCLKRYFIV